MLNHISRSGTLGRVTSPPRRRALPTSHRDPPGRPLWAGSAPSEPAHRGQQDENETSSGGGTGVRSASRLRCGPRHRLMSPEIAASPSRSPVRCYRRGRYVRQGNESRLTRHRPQYLHEISGVHGSALATPFDGALFFRRVGELTHEIEGEMADHGHVLGSVAYA
jgi:hypothetical protein